MYAQWKTTGKAVYSLEYLHLANLRLNPFLCLKASAGAGTNRYGDWIVLTNNIINQRNDDLKVRYPDLPIDSIVTKSTMPYAEGNGWGWVGPEKLEWNLKHMPGVTVAILTDFWYSDSTYGIDDPTDPSRKYLTEYLTLMANAAKAANPQGGLELARLGGVIWSDNNETSTQYQIDYLKPIFEAAAVAVDETGVPIIVRWISGYGEPSGHRTTATGPFYTEEQMQLPGATWGLGSDRATNELISTLTPQ